MVKLSGPNSTFPNQGPKSQHPFRRKINQLISLTSYGGNQMTLQGSQPHVSAGVGLAQFIRITQGQLSIGIKSFQSVVKASSIQYSLDNSIHPYRPHSINLYGLGPIGPFHIPL
ncbi:hypothetical protein O181_079532 [Austropuccinia psidii MF-1]|uniref:Uncharacterized protein n=1 Tax=Austropuccinia psidii MF-1 TaxID=1389203 RepID=A0A9Q3IGL7_9BASI|nr:hypothetical protein [Austropuccinia psidii MF-1]